MPDADDFLKTWIHQLTAMQSCMIQINTDTDPALAKFQLQKHADLLLTPHHQEQLRSSFLHKTNLTITAAAFAACGTFHELLDTCYRALLNAVVGLMREQAGGAFGDMSLSDFAAVKTSIAFPSGSIDGLCERLAANMDPLFAANNPRFRAMLGKPDTTVLSAAQSIA
jgi:hypothetical protein